VLLHEFQDFGQKISPIGRPIISISKLPNQSGQAFKVNWFIEAKIGEGVR
jgi:hypothetical protein